jgi:hypothetical protein
MSLDSSCEVREDGGQSFASQGLLRSRGSFSAGPSTARRPDPVPVAQASVLRWSFDYRLPTFFSGIRSRFYAIAKSFFFTSRLPIIEIYSHGSHCGVWCWCKVRHAQQPTTPFFNPFCPNYYCSGGSSAPLELESPARIRSEKVERRLDRVLRIIRPQLHKVRQISERYLCHFIVIWSAPFSILSTTAGGQVDEQQSHVLAVNAVTGSWAPEGHTANSSLPTLTFFPLRQAPPNCLSLDPPNTSFKFSSPAILLTTSYA